MNGILESMRSHATQCIACICAEAYLAPGPHSAMCILAQDEVSLERGGRKEGVPDGFGTWLVSEAEQILLIRAGGNHTIVYIPSCDMCYVADPLACVLGPECPAMSAFRAQFFLEADGQPRVLVFDAIQIGGKSMRNVEPAERYAAIDEAWFGGVVSRQWCGVASVLLDALQQGRFRVPHAVSGVVVLTADPMRLRAFGPSLLPSVA